PAAAAAGHFIDDTKRVRPDAAISRPRISNTQLHISPALSETSHSSRRESRNLSVMSSRIGVHRARRVLPGFGLSLGYTLTYLSLIVLIPLAAVFVKTTSLSFAEFRDAVTAPRVLASYKLSFGASLAAAAI